MARGKRGGGRGPTPPAGARGTPAKAARGVRASPPEADALSDVSEDFLPVTAGGADNESSGDEALLLRQMELEGAEDAADEEDEDDEGSTQGGSEGSELDAEGEGAQSENGDSLDDEEVRTAWGRRAKDFYGESSSGESSDDEEALQLRVAEAVRITEVEDVEGMNEEHFGADPRAIEGLRKLLDMQGKAQPVDPTAKEKGDTETADQELLWQARLDAEVGAILAGFSSTTEQHDHETQPAASGLSEEDLQQLVASAHPELQGLLQELREALVELNQKISPLVGLARSKRFFTKDGVSLFDTKNQLLLSYLSYLSYYVVLKAHGIPIASHPVVERLIESRLLLQKIRPIEATLKPQLDKLIQLARGGKQRHISSSHSRRSAGSSSRRGGPSCFRMHAGVETAADVRKYKHTCSFCSLIFLGPSAASPTARSRLDAFAAVGESDDEGADVASALDEEYSDEEAPEGGSHQKGTHAYKAPKMLAVEYTGDKVSSRTRAARELQRAAARLQKSELVRSVREVTGDAPEEIGIERWLAAKAHGLSAREAGLVGASTVGGDDEELEIMKRSLSKKEKKAQAAQRALFERRSAAAVGSTLEDLAMFADQPISLEEDAFDSIAGPLRRGRPKGALSHYLNAAKQAADEAAKAQKANAEKLVLARQQSTQHLSRRIRDTGRPAPRVPMGDGEGDEEFEAMASEARNKKAEKKKRMQDKANQFLPEIEQEVHGQRGVTREIEKNRGLIRKRKKFEGNARVHNRMKFQQKAKKLKSIRPDMRTVEDRTYEGETSGLRANLKKSRTLH